MKNQETKITENVEIVKDTNTENETNSTNETVTTNKDIVAIEMVDVDKQPTPNKLVYYGYIVWAIAGIALSYYLFGDKSDVIVVVFILAILYTVIVLMLNKRFIKDYISYLEARLDNVKARASKINYLLLERDNIITDSDYYKWKVNELLTPLMWAVSMTKLATSSNKKIQEAEEIVKNMEERLEEALQYDEEYPNIYKLARPIAVNVFGYNDQDNNPEYEGVPTSRVHTYWVKFIKEFILSKKHDIVKDNIVSKPWYDNSYNQNFDMYDFFWLTDRYDNNIENLVGYSMLNELFEAIGIKTMNTIVLNSDNIKKIGKLLEGASEVVNLVNNWINVISSVDKLYDKYKIDSEFDIYYKELKSEELFKILNMIKDFYNNQSDSKSYKALKANIDNYDKKMKELYNFVRDIAPLTKQIEEKGILNFEINLDLVKNMSLYKDTFSMVDKYSKFIDIYGMPWNEFKELTKYKNLFEKKFENIEENIKFVENKSRDIENLVELVSEITTWLANTDIDTVSSDINVARNTIRTEISEVERLITKLNGVLKRIDNIEARGGTVNINVAKNEVPAELQNYALEDYKDILTSDGAYSIKRSIRSAISSLKSYLNWLNKTLKEVDTAESNIKELRMLKTARLDEKVEDLNNRYIQLSNTLSKVNQYNTTTVETTLKYFDDLEKELLNTSFKSYYNTVNTIVSKYGGISGIRRLLVEGRKSLEWIIDFAKELKY